jgi:phosphoribosylaminoimidazolecarboxamide formyltransferase/IMP cyclohydrolase
MNQVERVALISVYDKEGLVPFASGLREAGFRILSTGGTAGALRRDGVEAVEVSEYTGSPEILGGRVKSLHPRIHGGLLGRPDCEADRLEMEKQDIRPIELLAVNLYPFGKTAADPRATRKDLVEMIDIGGPTMIRAAAKNHENVGVVVDPADYGPVLDEIRRTGGLSIETRRRLAVKAFRHTAAYDAGIVSGLERILEIAPTGPDGTAAAIPDQILFGYEKAQDLRYGENPHQRAAFFRPIGAPPTGIAAARQLQGKELSYNNLLDCDAAWRAICEFDSTAAVIIKHTNPCGVALGADPREAFAQARETDPVSAFGGIVAFNRPVDAAVAEILTAQFLECIIAPEFDAAALEILARKKNLRVLQLAQKDDAQRDPWDLRKLSGSLLVQDLDRRAGLPDNCRVVTRRQPTDEEHRGLDFAWRVVKHVKSNSVVFCRADRTVAVGAGQMSRVDSVKIARMKATTSLEGTVAASDAFFPFRDGLDALAEAGATAVAQPGGSIRDEEVIAAADEKGVAMVFTGVRHFRH